MSEFAVWYRGFVVFFSAAIRRLSGIQSAVSAASDGCSVDLQLAADDARRALEVRLYIVANACRSEKGRALVVQHCDLLAMLCELLRQVRTLPDSLLGIALALFLAVAPQCHHRQLQIESNEVCAVETSSLDSNAVVQQIVETSLLIATDRGTHKTVDQALSVLLVLKLHPVALRCYQNPEFGEMLAQLLLRVLPNKGRAADAFFEESDEIALRPQACFKAVSLLQQVVATQACAAVFASPPLLSVGSASSSALFTPAVPIEIIDSLTDLLALPKTLLWLPAQMQAAELLQTLVRSEAFSARCQLVGGLVQSSRGSTVSEEQPSSLVLEQLLYESRCAMQPHRRQPLQSPGL